MTIHAAGPDTAIAFLEDAERQLTAAPDSPFYRPPSWWAGDLPDTDEGLDAALAEIRACLKQEQESLARAEREEATWCGVPR
jgi:hypothetical protein